MKTVVVLPRPTPRWRRAVARIFRCDPWTLRRKWTYQDYVDHGYIRIGAMQDGD